VRIWIRVRCPFFDLKTVASLLFCIERSLTSSLHDWVNLHRLVNLPSPIPEHPVSPSSPCLEIVGLLGKLAQVENKCQGRVMASERISKL
jgi:hypothetical protein